MFYPGIGKKGIIGMFYNMLEQPFDKTWAALVGMLVQSDQASETYNWLGQAPGLEEDKDDQLHIRRLREFGMTLVNKEFSSSIEIDRRSLRLDKTNQLSVRISEMAMRAFTHWEELVTALELAGGTAHCYDGSAFYSASHKEGDSGTQSNLLTADDIGKLAVVDSDAPTQAELADAIMEVIAHMLGFKDDRGKFLNGNAREFTVMTSLNLLGTAMPISNQVGLRTSAGAIQDNPFKGSGIKLNIVANPALSTYGTTKFSVYRTDAHTRPFVLQEEEKPYTEYLGPDSEYAKLNKKCLFIVRAIRAAGYGMWQQAANATLSTAE